MVRNAWDSGNLRTLTKNSPAKASGAHISVVGHITRDELLRYLEDTEAANGFGNRFLWFCVRRSKALPEGGRLTDTDLAPIIHDLSRALQFARSTDELQRDAEARQVWHRVYEELSDGRPGLLGAMIARAEAQVMRIACIYALLDMSPNIRKEHLIAALAVWEYAEASAKFIFGERMGDPVADRIFDALLQAPNGVTRTEISNLFGRNQGSSTIDRALRQLRIAGLVTCVSGPTAGRPVEQWAACNKRP